MKLINSPELNNESEKEKEFMHIAITKTGYVRTGTFNIGSYTFYQIETRVFFSLVRKNSQICVDLIQIEFI